MIDPKILYEEGAYSAHMMYKAFLDAGFSEQQAFELLKLQLRPVFEQGAQQGAQQ